MAAARHYKFALALKVKQVIGGLPSGTMVEGGSKRAADRVTDQI